MFQWADRREGGEGTYDWGVPQVFGKQLIVCVVLRRHDRLWEGGGLRRDATERVVQELGWLAGILMSEDIRVSRT